MEMQRDSRILFKDIECEEVMYITTTPHTHEHYSRGSVINVPACYPVRCGFEHHSGR